MCHLPLALNAVGATGIPMSNGTTRGFFGGCCARFAACKAGALVGGALRLWPFASDCGRFMTGQTPAMIPAIGIRRAVFRILEQCSMSQVLRDAFCVLMMPLITHYSSVRVVSGRMRMVVLPGRARGASNRAPDSATR